MTYASKLCKTGYLNSGANGVGKSTTAAVVVSCIAILGLDFILAALLLWLKSKT